ncbi:MAG: hypothetical protein H0T73_18220 [Ardenticatenales bacterium]|nr:hypothetical protein [Ardenticatenales bacterium]
MLANHFYQKGVDYEEIGADDKALLHCEAALAEEPSATAYYLQGEYEVAITEFHGAAQRGADWATYFFLAECYRLTQRPLEVLRYLRRTLTLATCWEQSDLTHTQSCAC